MKASTKMDLNKFLDKIAMMMTLMKQMWAIATFRWKKSTKLSWEILKRV